MKIKEKEFEILQKAEKITLRDYTDKIYWKDIEDIDGYIDSYELFSIIEDLICEIGGLEELVQEYKNQLENPKSEDDEYDPYDKFIDHNEGII